MPERLRNYLDFHEKLTDADRVFLPLFHVCSQDQLMDYLTRRKIVEAKTCNVFKKKIIYTFYGASKYKGGDTIKKGSNGDRSVCLILDIEHCPNIFSIYPLDTGVASGTKRKLRVYTIPWNRIKQKLNLGNQKDRINLFILHCFKTLEDYVDGKYYTKDSPDSPKLRAKFTPPGTISQFSDIYKIITDQSNADNRRYCVEVLFDTELEINPYVVKGVIVCSDLLDDEAFKELLKIYRIQNIIGKNNLFYPSAAENNEDIEEHMKTISTSFTKKILTYNLKNV